MKVFILLYLSAFSLVYASSQQVMDSTSSPKNFEAEFYSFFQNYLEEIKAVKDESDNTKAADLAKDIFANYKDKAIELKSSLEAYKSDFTPEMHMLFNKRLKKHPVISELLSILYNTEFLERIEDNEDLKASMDMLDPINDILDGKGAPISNQEVAKFHLTKGNMLIQNVSVLCNLKSNALATKSDEMGNMEVQIDGMAENKDIEMYFTIDTANVDRDYWKKKKMKIILSDNDKEITYISKRSGKLTLDAVGKPGGIVSGKFSGKMREEGHAFKTVKATGEFKSIREKSN